MVEARVRVELGEVDATPVRLPPRQRQRLEEEREEILTKLAKLEHKRAVRAKAEHFQVDNGGESDDDGHHAR